MKVALDTNAFYAFMGISKDPNIKQDKFMELLSDPKNEVVIPTATLYEFFIKHEKNIDDIKNGISFIGQRITQEIISLPQYSDKKIYRVIKNCKDKRIETEASFSAFFLQYLLLQYTLSYFFEKEKKVIDEQTMAKLLLRCIPKMFQDTKKQMLQIIRDGYNIDKAQQAAANGYNSLLIDRLSSWLVFLEFIGNNHNSDLSENEFFHEYLQLFDNNHHVKKFNKSIDNVNKWIAQYDNVSNKIASTGLLAMLRAAFETKGVYGIQIDYMQWKLSSMSQQKIGETPSKFHKNDILDMLILTVLNDDDAILIAFDKNVRKFLGHIQNKSEHYINSVYSKPV
jgi:hypothetical protein